LSGSSTEPHGAVVTIGDELVCGDVSDVNGKWLARALEKLGVLVRLIATLPDDRASVAGFVGWAHRTYGFVVVAGGLGGTPDDVTRDAIADAFGVERRLDVALASELEAQGGYAAVFASEWCRLPVGSRRLRGTPGGAPPFAIENVYVLPGVPSEMRVTFREVRAELFSGPPRDTWRRSFRTTEDEIAALLIELSRLHGGVTLGSYPRFGERGPEVEIVLRGPDAEAVEAAASHAEAALLARGIGQVD